MKSPRARPEDNHKPRRIQRRRTGISERGAPAQAQHGLLRALRAEIAELKALLASAQAGRSPLSLSRETPTAIDFPSTGDPDRPGRVRTRHVSPDPPTGHRSRRPEVSMLVCHG